MIQIVKRIKIVKDLILEKLDAVFLRLQKLDAVVLRLQKIDDTISKKEKYIETSVESLVYNDTSILEVSVYLVRTLQQIQAQNKQQFNIFNKQLEKLQETQSDEKELVENFYQKMQILHQQMQLSNQHIFNILLEKIETVHRQTENLQQYTQSSNQNTEFLEKRIELLHHRVDVLRQSIETEYQKTTGDITYKDKEKLTRIKQLGFSPTCVCDIGASDGSWTKSISEVFPDASFHMFEPQAEAPEYKEGLAEVINSDIQCVLHPFALGSESAKLSLSISPNPLGSSLLVEGNSKYFPSSTVVDIIPLDEMVKQSAIPYPQLLKLDVQGYELEILKGATSVLKHVEVILVESWLVRGYGSKTPLLLELSQWLAQHGFFLFDFSGNYRDERGILVAQDCFFVKQPSSFVNI
ncbi:MAG: FkbM family methyltransferase [Calothrix sp. FI2-JRJ7]|jgi:FkbM family methyltransferase|nr:FkbM family methyltransferase [Calothrix sp. FI2-JRJ7]